MERLSVTSHAARRAIANALRIGFLCGLVGLCVDTDHVLRCVQDFSPNCVLDDGTKALHGLFGLVLCVGAGVVFAHLSGLCASLVDNPH